MSLLRFDVPVEEVERGRLRALLEAHASHDRARALLDATTSSLAAVGSATWVAMAAGVSSRTTSGRFLVVAWLAVLSGTAVAAARERRWRRAESRSARAVAGRCGERASTP